MAKKEIKEKNVIQAVKESVDNKKDKLSTKILIGFAVGVMLALLGYGIKSLADCGLSPCYLGGVSIGSLIATIVALVIDHLR